LWRILLTELYQAQAHAQNPAQTPWTANLGWRDLLAITGLLVGVVGLVIGWSQYKKAESATEAVRKVRRTLFRQRASQHFSALGPKALLLSSAIRGSRWDEAADLSTVVGAMLVNAAGYCSPLMNAEDNTNLELAAGGLRYLSENLPFGANVVEAATLVQMRARCVTILFSIERISGRMRSLDEFEEQS
jgi:hypothetical protein